MTRIPVLLIFFLLGCGDAARKPYASPADAMFTITDDAGRRVSLPGSPGRIIPLAPNLTELLYAIGAAPQVVAVSLADDYPPAVDTLPKYSSFPMDFEALVAYRPDVLIATDAVNNPKDAGQFTSIGMPILYYSFKTWDDIPRVMRSLGEVTGRQEQAQRAAASLETQLRNTVDKTANAKPVRTLFLIGSDQLYAFGKDNYIHEAIAYAGGESVTAHLDVVSPVLSEEFILTAAPEVILGTFRNQAQLLQNHPALRRVPAIVNGRVCTIEPSLVLRPGPRLVSGIKAMAACLHPALFAAHDLPGPITETMRYSP